MKDNGTDRPRWHDSLWRRVIFAAIMAFLLVKLYECSAQNAAQLQQYAHHHHAPAVQQ